MNGRLHFAIGIGTTALGFLGLQAMGVQPEVNILGGMAMAGIGSLAPDIDHPYSLISFSFPTRLLRGGLRLILVMGILGGFGSRTTLYHSIFPFIQVGLTLVILALVLLIASVIFSNLGHRGPTHSLLFAAGATFVITFAFVYFNFTWQYGLLFGWGYLLHLLADAPTEMGLPALLWPLYE